MKQAFYWGVITSAEKKPRILYDRFNDAKSKMHQLNEIYHKKKYSVRRFSLLFKGIYVDIYEHEFERRNK